MYIYPFLFACAAPPPGACEAVRSRPGYVEPSPSLPGRTAAAHVAQSSGDLPGVPQASGAFGRRLRSYARGSAAASAERKKHIEARRASGDS